MNTNDFVLGARAFVALRKKYKRKFLEIVTNDEIAFEVREAIYNEFTPEFNSEWVSLNDLYDELEYIKSFD